LRREKKHSREEGNLDLDGKKFFWGGKKKRKKKLKKRGADRRAGWPSVADYFRCLGVREKKELCDAGGDHQQQRGVELIRGRPGKPRLELVQPRMRKKKTDKKGASQCLFPIGGGPVVPGKKIKVRECGHKYARPI